MIRESLVLGLATLGVSAAVQAAVYDDFEATASNTIDGTKWTATGSFTVNTFTGPNQYIGASGQQGSKWADSWFDDGGNHDADTGSITSNTAISITSGANLLQFRLSGFSGNGGGGFSGSGPTGDGTNTAVSNALNTWQVRRISDNALLSQGSFPNENGAFRQYSVDLSSYIGQTVKVTFADASGSDWVAVDNVETVFRDATKVASTEIDGQSGWTLTGSTWAWQTKINNSSNIVQEGGEFLRAFDNGTGTATSPDFTITRNTLQFATSGFGETEGSNPDNRIYLRLASNDSLLATFGDDEALGGDGWTNQSLDVSAWANQAVYLEIVDAVSGGYGWVGIDDIRLSGDSFPPIPEPASLSLLGLGGLALLRRRRM